MLTRILIESALSVILIVLVFRLGYSYGHKDGWNDGAREVLQEVDLIENGLPEGYDGMETDS